MTEKRSYSLVLVVPIIIYVWWCGDPAPEYHMEYVNTAPTTREREFASTLLPRGYDSPPNESRYWDNPPDGPVPDHMIPEYTQREFDWKWGLPD